MKNSLLLFSILFLLSSHWAEAQIQTNAGIPDANHVLVVYKHPTDLNDSLGLVSQAVKNYYQNARGIPGSNIVRLDNLTDQDITIDGETHRVKIVQVTDMIQDSVNNANNVGITTRHSFKYFLDNVANPIKTHLVNNNLLSTIRYIVLCKGVPFKIQSSGDYASGYRKGNVTIDGLLCMLNTPEYDTLLLNAALFSDTKLSNPYNNVDPNFTMEYRFLPDHFIAREGHHLSYLVSHLDGISFDVVKSIIDSSLNPDMSGTATWIIDDDLTWSGGHFADARDKLEELGFNVFYDHSDTWITHYPEKVIGYTSWGTHAEDRNCEWEDSAWVKDSLHFDLVNGSVFNTYESFNGNSMTTLKWRYVPRIPPDCNHTQGLATQFTSIGGTATMGHAWEPGGSGVVENQIFFPAYQLGYSLIDAYYQGLPNLSSNVLVGDPLVRIYDCENTVISTNTTIGSGDYQCNIIVPQNVVLTIESGSTINFSRNASLKVYGTLQVNNNVNLNFNAYSNLIIDSIGTLNIGSGSQFVFNNHSKFILKVDFEITTNYDFVFNDESEFNISGTLNMDVNSSLTFNDITILTVNGSVNLEPGTNMNFNNNSKINVFGSLISLGESSNKVVFNFAAANANKISVRNGMRLEVDNTVINYSGIDYKASDNTIEIEHISIENSIFNNPINALSINFTGANSQTIPLISNCTFNNCNKSAIALNQVPEIILEHNTISLSSLVAVGIHLQNNGVVNILDCMITGGIKGIFIPNPSTDEIVIIENLLCILTIEQCVFETNIGVEIFGNNLFNSVIINGNHFQNCSIGISINNFSRFAPVITNNTITGIISYPLSSQFGITISNSTEALVSNNSITNFPVGLSLANVNTPLIKENFISAVALSSNLRSSGILAVSSNGEIRKNTIQNHKWGMELGSSSPNIGANKISNNLEYGIYIGAYSHPNLAQTDIGEELYPLTGYNTISDNGLCAPLLPSYSEIYITGANVDLSSGCNSISDDRDEPSLHCNYLYLIDGFHMEETIYAEKNYWGELNDHNPEGRFGNEISVIYDPYLEEPCTYSQGEEFLVLRTSEGEVIDTVYSSGIASMNLTDLESRYKTANGYYYNNQYAQAKQEYEGIIQNYGNSKGSLQAYNRLYTIANLISSTQAEFNQLKDFYMQEAGNQTDSLMIGTLTHLGDLCLVAAAEYLPAINNFDEIAQQNPNTDIALYRQIDALTTSLLIPQDSTLNKGLLGKYSIDNLSVYTNKLSELLKTRGKSGLKSNEELIPKEFTLYQNYPNPFNPVTTIKYDLPNTSDVSLIIYDILGRKIKELVNIKQQAGRYEVQFDASNLASGVYIYQLITEKYLNSKKMILLR